MALVGNISGSVQNNSWIGITGSVIIANNPDASFPAVSGLGSDVKLFVSGANDGTATAVFGGKLVGSGSAHLNNSLLYTKGSGVGAVVGIGSGSLGTENIWDVGGLTPQLTSSVGIIDNFVLIGSNTGAGVLIGEGELYSSGIPVFSGSSVEVSGGDVKITFTSGSSPAGFAVYANDGQGDSIPPGGNALFRVGFDSSIPVGPGEYAPTIFCDPPVTGGSGAKFYGDLSLLNKKFLVKDDGSTLVISGSTALADRNLKLEVGGDHEITLQPGPQSGGKVGVNLSDVDGSTLAVYVGNTGNTKFYVSSSGDVLLSRDLTVQGSGSIDGDLEVNGVLTVWGTASYMNVENVLVKDPFILLNSGSLNPDSGIVFGGGAGSTDVVLGVHAKDGTVFAATHDMLSGSEKNIATAVLSNFYGSQLLVGAGGNDVSQSPIGSLSGSGQDVWLSVVGGKLFLSGYDDKISLVNDTSEWTNFRTVFTDPNISIISALTAAYYGGPPSYFESTQAGKLHTTGSVAFNGNDPTFVDTNNVGSDVFLYVSGTVSSGSITEFNASSQKAVFGGDVLISGSVKVVNDLYFASGSIAEYPGVTSNRIVLRGNSAAGTTSAALVRIAGGDDAVGGLGGPGGIILQGGSSAASEDGAHVIIQAGFGDTGFQDGAVFLGSGDTGYVSISPDTSGPATTDTNFYVSGSIAGTSTESPTRKSVFNTDVVVSGSVNFERNMYVTGSIIPEGDLAHALGSDQHRWSNIYTGDLHLRNDRGDWTVIEEETYLSLRNNKTGKLFRLVMEPVEE